MASERGCEMAENLRRADRHLRDGLDNLHKAASFLATERVSPQSARELEQAVELVRNAMKREKLAPREVSFAL